MACHRGRSRHHLLAVAVLATVALAADASTEYPQQSADKKNQQPTFRARVDLVEIDLVANDATGRPVLDLKKEELHVVEDGKSRER
jgi:hypothetical protein